MKQAIYYNLQRIFFGKQERQLIFSTHENHQLSLLNNSFSSEILSISSPVMRMCCCSMSC